MNESCRIIHVLTNGTLCAEEKHRRDLRPLFKRRERVNMEVCDIVWRLIPVRILYSSAIRTPNGLWMTNYTVIDGKGLEHKISEYALLKNNPRKPHADYLNMLCTRAAMVHIVESEPLSGADFEEEEKVVMEEKRPWWRRMKREARESVEDDTLPNDARAGQDRTVDKRRERDE